MGCVEYYFDILNKTICRRQARYGQAIDQKFDKEQILVRNVNELMISFVYPSSEGEEVVDAVSDIIPSGVDIEVAFSDSKGEREMRKFINIPIGSRDRS